MQKVESMSSVPSDMNASAAKQAGSSPNKPRLPAFPAKLLDSMPQMVWLADLEGSVTYVNRGWAENIGLVDGDWEGDQWAASLHPEDCERVMTAWHEAAPRDAVFEIEYRLLHREGGYHDYHVEARKVTAGSGDAECWVGICNDVTDSRCRERALRLANQELEAFASSVSHDLRAPLRAIAGFGERLQAEYGDSLDEPGRHFVERIRASAAHMSELIDDLLSLARVTSTDLAMIRVDLSVLAREVFDELRQSHSEHPAEISIQANMAAIGDARLLRIVLVNLIGNALKFSGKRDVSRIDVGETPLPGNTSLFFVRDNGAGFNPGYAAKLFGIFQRLHSAKEFPGTGIGLATVQRIVQRHGGSVRAEGLPDQGATISFVLRRE